MTATKAAQVVPQATSLPAEVQDCPRVELKGKRVLVVGHGPVGHDFIVKLVGMVGDGALDITVVGEEPRMAYDRVHLTEYFAHRDASKLSMCDEKWFADHKVSLKTSVRAEKIDRDSCNITLRDVKSNDTQEMAFDACVLCTGSYPFVPPLKNLSSEVAGVYVYRTIEDLEGMILMAKKSTRAAVIGGGLLGLEAAKAVYDLGQESHGLEMAPFLMPTQLDQGAGEALQGKIQAMGITLHLS